MNPNPASTPARPGDEHATSAYPGFPFPPPMMGLSAPTVNAASSPWLLTVAAMLETGEMNLMAL